MNANLVNILTWAKPVKTTAALISINVILWILIRQRPLCVLPLVFVVLYLRNLWKHRIRPEVFVDPPDHEEWITLSSYDFEHVACTLSKRLWSSWTSLRHEHHLLWTVGTCTVWAVLAKIGQEVDFLTLLFLVSNGAFVIFPMLDRLPKTTINDRGSVPIVQTQGASEPQTSPLSADKGRSSFSLFSSNNSTLSEASPAATSPVDTSLPVEEPLLASSVAGAFEGLFTRSVSAAASLTSTSIFSSAGSLLLSHRMGELRESSPGPESLTPAVAAMPDHEVIDSDPEDEFLFDAKHFDKSSSSSISNSFEIIDDL